VPRVVVVKIGTSRRPKGTNLQTWVSVLLLVGLRLDWYHRWVPHGLCHPTLHLHYTLLNYRFPI